MYVCVHSHMQAGIYLRKKVLFYAGMYICTYTYMNFYKFTHLYKD